MSVREIFRARAAAGEKVFIPFLIAGDPDFAATAKFVKALARAGADIIELGLAFSDPVADGEVNQRSAERALRGGSTLAALLNFVKNLRAEGFTTPLVLFTYFNPLLRMGLNEFADGARVAGFAAVLVVDLPPEEASAYRETMRAAGLECVFLASPTTAPSRWALIEAASTGFLYYVSRTGVTGTQADLSASLETEVASLKAEVRAPVAVGFGISTPAQAVAAARGADGVIVGSAVVKVIAENVNVDQTAARLEIFAREFKEALKCSSS